MKDFSIDTENFSAVVFKSEGKMWISISESDAIALDEEGAITFSQNLLGEFVQLLSDIEDELGEDDPD